MFSLKEAISSTPQYPKSLCDNKLKIAGGELRPNQIEAFLSGAESKPRPEPILQLPRLKHIRLQ
jgi:hypothetical protein